MEHVRTGVILNTENYDACVLFYREVLGLNELFSKVANGHKLSCFEFGGAYLMIETGGYANAGGKSIKENCAKLRFNVQSLQAAQEYLSSRGVKAEISRFAWGSTINIYDPDGNRIGIREERDFSDQMRP